MRKFIIILSVFLASCSNDEQPAPPPGPITSGAGDIYLVSSEDNENYTPGERIGRVSIQYQDGVSTMEITLSNMGANSSHAMHLHLGTLEVPGRHWNQNLFTAFCNVESLGSVWAKPFAGDVGNISINQDGNGTFTIQTDLWSLGTGEDSDIQNTVLFIHQNEEDFLNECDPNHSHTHGHMNAKIAGGTILLESQEEE